MNKFNTPVLVAVQVKTGPFTYGSSKFNVKMKFEYKEDEDWEEAMNADSEDMRGSQLEKKITTTEMKTEIHSMPVEEEQDQQNYLLTYH